MEIRLEFQAGISSLASLLYLYIAEAVGFVWSNELESFAGGSVVSSRDRSEVMTQIKRDIVFQFGGRGVKPTTLPSFDAKIGRNVLKPVVGK